MNRPRRQPAGGRREPVTMAIVAAILVTAVLGFAIFAIWAGVAPNGSRPRAVAPAPRSQMTPTPRAINWPDPTAIPGAIGTPEANMPAISPRPRPAHTPNVADVPAINPAPRLAPAPSTLPAPTATSLPAPSPEATPTTGPSPEPSATPEPSPTPTPEPAYAAADGAGFSAIAGGGWSVQGNRLVYGSPQAMAEPLLLVPYQTRSGNFAIEAEVRVDGLAQGVCNQSFGVVAGSPVNGLYWGGGVIYSCGSTTPAARITDVSNWTNGYDQDRQLARAELDLDDGWHRYRLELRGDELRLLIDGEEVLAATDPALLGTRATGQAGLWTQGARLTVRSVAIHEL